MTSSHGEHADTETFDSRGTNRRLEYAGTIDTEIASAVIGAESEVSRFRSEGFGAISSRHGKR